MRQAQRNLVWPGGKGKKRKMTRHKIIQQAGCRAGAEEKPLEPQGSKQEERGAQGAGGAWLKQRGKPPLFILPPGPHTNLQPHFRS